MFKSVITLLLIPSLLLTQWVGMPHSHSGMTDDEHGVRAHIHLQGQSESEADHSHDAAHSKHGNRHNQHSHSAHDGHDHPLAKDVPIKDGDSLGGDRISQAVSGCWHAPFDHAADCIYVSEVIVAGFERTMPSDFTFSRGASCVNFWVWAEPKAQLVSSCSLQPPPLSFCNCPLYLRNLSLRI